MSYTNIQITNELIKDYFKGIKLDFTQPPKVKLWDAYEEFLKSGELEKAVNTNKNRKTIKKYLENFESETGFKMTFESIDLEFFDR